MVRYHNAVDAERHCLLGVLRMEDALDHQRAPPEVAIARDLLPSECAAHSGARKHRSLREACGLSRATLAAGSFVYVGQQGWKTADGHCATVPLASPATLRWRAPWRDRAGTAS